MRRSERIAAICIAVLCVGAGIFFRLHDIGRRVPFEDEAMTWLRTSGYTEAELNRYLYDGRTHTAGDIALFQRRTPTRGVADTVRALAVDDPQHAPLYFMLEHASSDLLGDSLSARRILSVLSGIGFIAAFARLCFLLFQNARAPFIGASLAALSPFHIVYSQQAREYELWAFWICVWSCAAILAVRRNTRAYWIAYAFCAAIALYISLLSLPLLLAHALWTAMRPDVKTRILAFSLAAGGALFAYAPWLLNLAARKQSAVDANTWTATTWPLRSFFAKWAFNLSAAFFDLTYLDARYAIISACVLIAILFALVDLQRRRSPENAAFVMLLGGVSLAAFLLPDLLFHQHRSVTARYVLPVFIATQAAVVGMLAEERVSERARYARVALFAVFIFLGAWSAFVRSGHTAWWENNKDAALPAIADALNVRLQTPLLAEDGTSVLALVDLLDPRVRIRMLDPKTSDWFPAAQRGAFVLTPSPTFRARLQKMGLRPEPIIATLTPTSLRAFRGNLPQAANSSDISLDILR